MTTSPEGAYKTLRLSRVGPVLELSIHRPEQRNSINDLLLSELGRALDEAERDAQNRVIVLSGEAGVFCTGMDLQATAKTPAGVARGSDAALFMGLLKRMGQIPRVVIAKVEGTAMAGGVGLVAASDLVYASPKATFSLSEALWGLLPAMVTPFLIRRVGFQKAYAMTMTTRSYSASEALAMGLVDTLADDPDREIQMATGRMAHLDPRTIADLKAYFRKMWIVTEEMERTAVAELERLLREPRIQENIRAYVELGKLPWNNEDRAAGAPPTPLLATPAPVAESNLVSKKMSKDEIFALVKEKILDVLFDLPESAIERTKSLKELGANSLDRSEIAMASMEALGLNFPQRELAGVKNIEGLVSLLHEKLGA